MDLVSVGLKVAEVMVELKDSLGLPSASGVVIYARLREKDIRRVRPLFGLAEKGYGEVCLLERVEKKDRNFSRGQTLAFQRTRRFS